MGLRPVLLAWLVGSAAGARYSYNVTWSPHSPAVAAPDPRAGASLVPLGSTLFLFGGRGPDGRPASQSLLAYNLVSKAWQLPSLTGDPPAPRFGQAAAAVQGAGLLIQGGFGSSGALADLWLLDLAKMRWRSVATTGGSPSARGYHSLTELEGQSYFLCGGVNASEPTEGAEVMNQVWRLQLNCATNGSLVCTGVWKQLTLADPHSTALQRYGHAAVNYGLSSSTAKDQVVPFVLIMQGADQSFTPQPGVSVLSVSGDTVSAVAAMESSSGVGPLQFHTAVSDQSFIYVYGGMQRSGQLSGELLMLERHGNMNVRLSADYPPTNTSFDPRAGHSAALVGAGAFLPGPGWYCPACMPDGVVDPHKLYGKKMNCGVVMLFGGRGVERMYNDMRGYRNFSLDDRVFLSFWNSRASAKVFMRPLSSRGIKNGSTLHVVGGEVNTDGSDPGAFIVPAQQDLELSLDAGPVITPAAQSSADAAADVGSLRDFSMVLRSKPEEVIVHGGRTAPLELGAAVGVQLNISQETYRFDSSGKWTRLECSVARSSMLVPRYSHCAAMFDAQTMIVFGGAVSGTDTSGGVHNLLGNLALLNLNTLEWNSTQQQTPVGQSIFGHACTMIDSHRLVITGGIGTDSNYEVPSSKDSWNWVTTTYMYDFAQSSWTQLSFTGGSYPVSFAFHSVLAGPNQTLLAIGGLTKDSSTQKVTATNEVYSADFAPCVLDPSDDYCDGWYKPASNGSLNADAPALYRHSIHPMPLHQQGLSFTKQALVYGGVTIDGSISDTIWDVNFGFDFVAPAPPTIAPTTLAPTTAPPLTAAPTSNREKDTTELVIIASVSIVLVILAVGFCTMIYYRRHAAKIQEFQDSLAAGMAPGAEEDSQPWQGPIKENPEDYRNWEKEFGSKLLEAPDFVIRFCDLRMVKQIGHGSSCVVHVGWWGDAPVAIKRFFLHRNYQPSDFYRETLVHKQLDHQNVLPLLAITINPPCSVTPLMRHGSLFHILQSTQELQYSHILQIAIDAVDGMRYLHSQDVIHRDLKTLNLLVDDSWNVKVCDFGIARFQVSAMTAAIGSIQYMAPEVFVSNHYTTKSDVYSFAIILWEMATRQVPYADSFTSPFAVCCNVREGKRLEIPSSCRPEYTELIEKCWCHDANLRPDFEEVFAELQAILKEAEKEAEQLHGTPRQSLRDSMKELLPSSHEASFATLPGFEEPSTRDSSVHELLLDPAAENSSKS